MGLKDVAPELAKHIELAKKGEVVKIPNPLGSRVGDIFNLLQSRYTLLVGATGSGKTALTDYIYILSSFDFVKGEQLRYEQKYKDTPEDERPHKLHWEVNYFSLERKQMFKKAKWISWFLKAEYNMKISADAILGWETGTLSDEVYKLVEGYWEILDELLDYVTIYDGKVAISTLESVIHERARALGVFFKTDAEGLFVDDNPLPIKTFEEHGVKRKTRRGEVLEIEFEYKGEKHSLRKHSHKYFLHNPRTLVNFVIDGIGLFGGSDFSNKKSSIDRVSEILSDARDHYGFSPVVVSQINRAIGDVQRHKLHGSDLSPQIEDVEGSSRTSHDADLIVAIFDAFRYKAYDDTGNYGGYSVTQGMMSPKGFCRFRSFHILKNSFGIDGKKFGLCFVGESNDFLLLPRPDEPELSEVYVKIAQNTI